MTDFYNEDLAYIHDVGFRDYVLQAMPEILTILKQKQLSSRFIVDLGCGSGLSTEVLDRAGYPVLGIDISEAMIAIAQARVPTAKFRVASLFTAEIPLCAAVISIGEGLSYAFDANSDTIVEDLYRRTDEVHHQRLFDTDALADALQQKGFQVDICDRYGQFSLPPARVAFIAHKLV
jgi:SAM-dependent methyltransferase